MGFRYRSTHPTAPLSRQAMFKTLKVSTSYAVAFSTDSRLLATLGRDVWVWNLAARKKAARAHPFAHPSSACFSPSGDQLAVKSTSGEIALISTQDGALIRNFRNSDDGEGSNIQYSACGDFIVDGSWEGRMFVRHASSGKIEFSVEFPGEMITDIDHDAKGETWVLAHSPKATSATESPASCYFSVWRWPFARENFTHFPARVPFARRSALAPDATRLAVIHGAPLTELSVFDMASGARCAACSVRCGGTGYALAWSPDAEFLGSIQATNATIYHTKTLEPWRNLVLPYPSHIAFSPNGCLVAIGSWKAGVVLAMMGDAP
jgi:WD40 repeat protein